MPALLPAGPDMIHHARVSHRLGIRRYRLPFQLPHRTAHGAWIEREGLIVRAEGPPGKIGFGEVAPIPALGTETLAEAEAVLARLGAVVAPDSLAALDERYGCVRFGLACAVGGEPGAAAAGERRPVAALLPAGREALAAAERARDGGYTAFKWKVGVLAAADELALLDDLLAQLPAGARLRLDANGAWTSRQAARWMERCAERPVEFVEQPCWAGSAAGTAERRRADDTLRGLARDYPTPVALDESVAGLASLRSWLEGGWRGIVVVKPALAGAPEDVLAVLEAHRADVVFSSALETAVGRQAALRTALRYRHRPARALGFGVLPLFQDRRFDGGAATPFVTADEVERLNLEAAWNALN